MKSFNRNIALGIGTAGALLLSACLKESTGTADFNSVKPAIEQLNSPNFTYKGANSDSLVANQNSYFMQVRVDSTGSGPDSIVVNIAGATIGKDVTVTIGVDTGAFNTFNANNGGTYVMLSSAAYSIPSLTGVIKAGKQQVAIPITFNTKLIDFTQFNILPITITSASGNYAISANYGTTLYAIVEGNQYMGLYRSVGQRQMGTYTYSINDLKSVYDLSAIFYWQGSYPTANGSNTPTGFVPNVVVTNCADQTVYLSIGEQMDLTINPDNTVTVSNDNLYGFGTSVYPLVSGPSTYNPSTHVFNLSYGYVDPNTLDSATVTEVITRVR